MLKATRTSIVNHESVKTDVELYADSTMWVADEHVQVMSDIWEMAPVLHYIDKEGRHGTSGMYGENVEFTVDVTDEAYDRFEAHESEIEFRKLEVQAEDHAKDVCVKGRIVKVVKGRNNKGALGKVVVTMYAQYGMGYRSSEEMKLGIALDGETVEVVKNGRTYTNYKNMVWAWARNCELETVEEFDATPLYLKAAEIAKQKREMLEAQAKRNQTSYGMVGSYSKVA